VKNTKTTGIIYRRNSFIFVFLVSSFLFFSSPFFFHVFVFLFSYFSLKIPFYFSDFLSFFLFQKWKNSSFSIFSRFF